jgi:hypothetical protein
MKDQAPAQFSDIKEPEKKSETQQPDKDDQFLKSGKP